MKNVLDIYNNYSKDEPSKLLSNQVKSNVKLESEKDKLEQQVSYLKFQLEQFKRAMFGSKRERFISLEISGQFLLPFDVNEQEVLEAVEVVVEQISYQRKKAGVSIFVVTNLLSP